MELNNKQIEYLYELINKETIVVNGDKQKLFKLIAEIKEQNARLETDLKHVIETMKDLPCKEHQKDMEVVRQRVSDNRLTIEKSKWTIFIAFFSILASLGSVLSVIILYFQYVKP